MPDIEHNKHTPPPTLRRRFCATCGLLVPSAHNPKWHKGRSGTRCPGKTKIIVYVLNAQ